MRIIDFIIENEQKKTLNGRELDVNEEAKHRLYSHTLKSYCF